MAVGNMICGCGSSAWARWVDVGLSGIAVGRIGIVVRPLVGVIEVSKRVH